MVSVDFSVPAIRKIPTSYHRRYDRNNGRSQVVAEIKKDCMKQLIGNDNVSAYQYSQKIKDMVNDNIKSFLEENKETIIKEAVNQLAEKLSRTKAAKEALSKTLGDIF